MIHALLLSLALAGPAPAAREPSAPRAPAAVQDPEKKGDEVKRLEAWPDLGAAKKTAVTDVQRLRKARTPEMAEEAEAALVAAGAGVVPHVLPALGKEKDEAALERLERVLLAVTGAPHTRLLAASFKDRSLAVRSFALRRCAAFPDEGVRAAAEAALAKVRKLGERADSEERYAAALCVTSSGSLEAFDIVSGWSLKRWGKRGPEMRTALVAVRGPEATARAIELLKGEREQTVVALNLLSGCGDESSTAHVKPFLDSDDNSIRVAAINALRGIVNGEGPIERLPVFEAIELAKQWKSRV